jgi:hypothetical protein
MSVQNLLQSSGILFNNQAVMKSIIFYLVIAFVVGISATLAISNIDFKSFSYSLKTTKANTDGMPADMAKTPKGVQDTIGELESYRSHLSETCIYGAAMVLNDLSNEAQKVIDDESKCIHSLVMSVSRNKKLTIRAEKMAQLKTEQTKLVSSNDKSNTKPNPNAIPID